MQWNRLDKKSTADTPGFGQLCLKPCKQILKLSLSLHESWLIKNPVPNSKAQTYTILWPHSASHQAGIFKFIHLMWYLLPRLACQHLLWQHQILGQFTYDTALKKENQFQLYSLSFLFSVTAHIFINIATNLLPMVWNESYIRYICTGMLMVWLVGKKRTKTNPQNRALKPLKTNIVHIHYSSYTSHKCNILWRKLLLKGNPKRQSFFSVMFSKIMWVNVGNHRLKFLDFFFS